MFFWVACAWCLAHVLVGPRPAPSPRVVGSRRRHARPRAAQQVRGGAPGRAAPASTSSTRREPAPLARHPGPTSRWRIALCIFAPVDRVECPAPLGVVLLPEHARLRGLQRDPTGLAPQERRGPGAGHACPWLWVGLVFELVRGSAGGPAARAAIHLLALRAAHRAVHRRRRVVEHQPAPLPLGRRPAISCSSSRSARRCTAACAGSRLYRWGLGATAAAHADRDHRADQPYRDRLAPGPARPVAASSPASRIRTYECVDITGLERAFVERGLLDRHDVFVVLGLVVPGRQGRLRAARASCPSSPSPGTTRGASHSSTGRSATSARTASSSPPRPPPR